MAANRNLLTGFLFKRGKRRGAASLIKDRTNDASDVVLDSWLFDSGATSITGTLSATEGVDSLSATGEASGGAVEGSFTATEGADAIFGSGLVIVSGSFAATETADSLSTSGSVLVGGVGALSETTDSLAATGSVVVGSVFSAVEAEDTASAIGNVLVEGVSELPEDADSLGAFGSVGSGAVEGTFSATEDADTLIAYGLDEYLSGGGAPTKRAKTSSLVSDREKKKLKELADLILEKQAEVKELNRERHAVQAQKGQQSKASVRQEYALHEKLLAEQISSITKELSELAARRVALLAIITRLEWQESIARTFTNPYSEEADMAFVMAVISEC